MVAQNRAPWNAPRSTTPWAASPPSALSPPSTTAAAWRTRSWSTPFSRGVRADHVERLAAYWAEVFGGPRRYSERYGGEPAMMGMHAGYGINPETGRRFIECFVAAQDAAGVPDDAELRRALRGYMEWAVGGVLSRQAPGDTADPGGTVPHWDWDGLDARG